MYPEHFDLASPLPLPITEETCARLLGANGEKTLATLTNPELAAVLVIQHLAEIRDENITSNAIEKILAKLIAWTVDGQHSVTTGLLSEAQRLFDPSKFYSGGKAARRLRLRFLRADDVAARDYLLPNGKWDVGFKSRYYQANNPFSEQMITPRHRERWLSPAQDKLIRIFRANLDEDLHVQGYAGIGKSHLLGTLVEYLRPEATLLLAHSPGKLDALRKRIGGKSDKKMGLTFRELALFLLYGPRHKLINVSTGTSSKRALAQELNILGMQGHEAQNTLDICSKILGLYCKSRDHTLSAKHFPHFNQPLSDLDTKVLLEYSIRLWAYLESNPNWGSQLELESLLAIKRASLEGCVIPPRYTHVLIDESQDIPSSLLQIIERGRQVLITLGDEYQQAAGPIAKRKREVRKSEINYSVRSGRNIESLVNPLIYRHSSKGKLPFEGASNTDIRIKHYPSVFLPPAGCVVLSASRWDMMKWIMQMSAANRALTLPNTKMQQDLKQFMRTAIALFKPDFYNTDPDSRELHSDFSEMSNWQKVRDANQYDESFLWVEAELEKGFNIADMNQLKGLLGQSESSCTIMMAKDAGGMEFNEVLLTPELLTTVKFKDAYELDQRICSVYIAISRAKRKIYIPYNVEEWVEYQSHQGYRELSGY